MLNYKVLAQRAAEEVANDKELLEFARKMTVHKMVIDIDIEAGTVTVNSMRKDPIEIEHKGSAVAEI